MQFDQNMILLFYKKAKKVWKSMKKYILTFPDGITYAS